jgi:predicted nucleic acid-binding protein
VGQLLKRLVLDANILIGAVLGKGIRQLLQRYAISAEFYAPDKAFIEAAGHLPALALKRRFEPEFMRQNWYALTALIDTIKGSEYEIHESASLRRISSRDADDWPVLATAMLLNCAIWTEDHDFFGTGIATWTTRNIEIYLQNED